MELIAKLNTALADRYVVAGEVGAGGMAVVFQALDRKHDRNVAIKVLRPELRGTLTADRFLQEIHISAGLQHPNILPLLDSGEVDGLLYFVTPLVDGETLRAKLDREGPLSVEDVEAVVHGVAVALDHAHSRGIVHRDIKPGNVFLSGGQAMVGDFGVAHAVSSAGGSRLTETGMAVGTAAYISPEQAAGEKRLDGRSDVYSLGCMAFEMLAGEPPFTGSNRQSVIAKHASQRPPPLRVVRPTVPWGVAHAIERSLAKVPADRYPTAVAFAKALSQGRSQKEAPRPSRWPRGRALAAFSLMALGALVIWTFWPLGQPALDESRIVVFPLVTPEEGPIRSEVGEELAILVGNALDRAEPLRWEDGWDWLTPQQRDDARLIRPGELSAIARERGAAFYVDGRVVPEGSQATVLMRLHRVDGDSVIARGSSTGSADEAGLVQSGLQAISPLLPAIVQAGEVDLADLRGAEPAAMVSWLYGEREYRRSNYAAARTHFLEALTIDSTLAVAALGAAQSGVWEERITEAEGLLDLARRRGQALPLRRIHFIRGMQAELAGAADTAVYYYERAVAADSSWAEAWMGLGEVYYHLLPHRSPLDSLAEASFSRALSSDPDFLPPRFHLAEIALRAGDYPRASEHLRLWRERGGDPAMGDKIELMLQCAREGPDAVDWAGSLAADLSNVLLAAKAFSGGGTHSSCVERGFREVLSYAEVDPNHAWAALLGLTGLYVAHDDAGALQGLLSSEAAQRISGYDRLYLIASTAVPNISTDAPAVRDRLAQDVESRPGPDLWVLGSWAARNGEVGLLRKTARLLRERAAGSDLDRFLADIMSCHETLVGGDSLEAVACLEALEVRGDRPDLAWSPWEPLALETLLVAELRLHHGDPSDALAVASAFDSPQPVMFLFYLPESLRIRRDAARALGDQGLASKLDARLRGFAQPPS